METRSIEDLVGKTATSVYRNGPKGDLELVFELDDGSKAVFYHMQDCCEDVYIESVTGDLDNLVGSPILVADKRTESGGNGGEFFTFTFYTFRTIKGTVDVRWDGFSNGYYSESVDFRIEKSA